MDLLQFVTGMTGNVMNYNTQKEQLAYQESLNDWQVGNYDSRNQAFKDALMHSSLGLSNLGSAAYGYVNNRNSLNYTYNDFLRDNPQLAQEPASDNYAKYQDFLKNSGNSGAFDINDFITLYNIGQNEITRQREDTAISRAVKDWENAGLNPLLFGGSGASTSSYQTSGSSNQRPSGLQSGSYTPFNMSVSSGDIADDILKLSQAKNLQAQTSLVENQRDKINSETLLNGSLLPLNDAQTRLYRQQINYLGSQIPLNNLKKDILLQELSGLQWNLSLAKKYGINDKQAIPIAIAGLDHIIDGVANSSTSGYIASGIFGLATLIPMFKLGSLGANALINFGKSKFGYKRVDKLLDTIYDMYDDGKSYFEKYFRR